MTRTVLITGATSGFGAAAVHRFAQAGWKVIATGRRQDRLQALRIRAQGMDHRVHEVHRYRIAFAHLLPIFRIWQKTPAFLRGCGIGEASRQTLDSTPSLAVTAWRACNFNRHQRGADHST